jgi:hypothetical protein
MDGPLGSNLSGKNKVFCLLLQARKRSFLDYPYGMPRQNYWLKKHLTNIGERQA